MSTSERCGQKLGEAGSIIGTVRGGLAGREA